MSPRLHVTSNRSGNQRQSLPTMDRMRSVESVYADSHNSDSDYVPPRSSILPVSASGHKTSTLSQKKSKTPAKEDFSSSPVPESIASQPPESINDFLQSQKAPRSLDGVTAIASSSTVMPPAIPSILANHGRRHTMADFRTLFAGPDHIDHDMVSSSLNAFGGPAGHFSQC